MNFFVGISVVKEEFRVIWKRMEGFDLVEGVERKILFEDTLLWGFGGLVREGREMSFF